MKCWHGAARQRMAGFSRLVIRVPGENGFNQ